MNGGKGKGRAIIPHDGNIYSTAGQSALVLDSLLGRVTSSAAGLARSAFTAPTTAELSNHDSTAISGSGKGGRASGSRSSAWAESSRAAQPPSLQNLQLQAHSSLRGEHTENYIQRNEAEFSSFLAGIDPFNPSSKTYPEGTLADIQARDDPQRGSNLTKINLRDTNGVFCYGSVNEQQEHDGENVIAMLTRPSNPDYALEEMPLVDDEIDWGLTDEHMLSLKPVLKELFPPGSAHVTPRPNHPLNLIPNIISDDATLGLISSISADEELFAVQSSTGVAQGTARQLWMSHWEGVLTRYTDEVWGDLLPLVVKACQEVEAIRADPQKAYNKQPGALRRLQLVLNHLRNP